MESGATRLSALKLAALTTATCAACAETWVVGQVSASAPTKARPKTLTPVASLSKSFDEYFTVEFIFILISLEQMDCVQFRILVAQCGASANMLPRQAACLGIFVLRAPGNSNRTVFSSKFATKGLRY